MSLTNWTEYWLWTKQSELNADCEQNKLNWILIVKKKKSEPNANCEQNKLNTDCEQNIELNTDCEQNKLNWILTLNKTVWTECDCEQNKLNWILTVDCQQNKLTVSWIEYWLHTDDEVMLNVLRSQLTY